jgi:hypothetical protein
VAREAVLGQDRPHVAVVAEVARIARVDVWFSLFELIWGQFADEEAPEPGHREISWPKLLVALTIEGAIFRLTRGLIDRGARVAFVRATGSWPGERKPEQT